MTSISWVQLGEMRSIMKKVIGKVSALLLMLLSVMLAWDSSASVSYTHLDVYKRQEQFW